MDLNQKMLAAILAGFLIIALLRVFSAPLRLALRILANTLLGFLALWAVNLTAAVTGISLGLNIWNALKQAWEDTKDYFGEYYDAYGGDIVAALLAGIVGALGDLGKWCRENILEPLFSGMREALGIDDAQQALTRP